MQMMEAAIAEWPIETLMHGLNVTYMYIRMRHVVNFYQNAVKYIVYELREEYEYLKSYVYMYLWPPSVVCAFRAKHER